MQLRGDRAKFRRLGARVVLVGLGTPERAEWFCRDRHLSGFVCLTDPTKHAHQAFGLKRGSLRQVLGPHMYPQWVRVGILPDVWPKRPKEDWLQMPGTFVIDPEGIIRYAHRNRDVTDNPPNAEILAVLDGLREAKPA